MSNKKRYSDENIKNAIDNDFGNYEIESEEAQDLDQDIQNSPNKLREQVENDFSDTVDDSSEYRDKNNDLGHESEPINYEEEKNSSFVTKIVSKFFSFINILSVFGKKKKSRKPAPDHNYNKQKDTSNSNKIFGIPKKKFYIVIGLACVGFFMFSINTLFLERNSQTNEFDLNPNQSKAQSSNTNKNINPITNEKYSDSQNNNTSAQQRSSSSKAKSINEDKDYIDKKFEKLKENIVKELKASNENGEISLKVKSLISRVDKKTDKALSMVQSLKTNFEDMKKNESEKSGSNDERLMELDKINHELSLKNKELSDEISRLKRELKKTKQNVDGNNKISNSKAAENQNTKQKLKFTGWKIVGVSNGVCVFGKKENPNETVIIREGENFMGVEIKEVNIKDEVIRTNIGKVSFNEIG